MRLPATCAGIALALSVCAARPAAGGDLGKEPIGFRISAALDRAANFTDVTALSASTAYPYGSSVNPAADDYLRLPPNDFTAVGTLTGNYILLRDGGSVAAGAASASYRFPRAGTASVALARSESDDVVSHQGDRFRLRSTELTLGYSHGIATGLTAGADVRLTDSTLDIATTAFDLPVRVDTSSEGADLRVGALVGLGREWTFGVTGSIGWTRSRTEGVLETPPPPFGFGPQHFRSSDEVMSNAVRTGVGWRPSDAVGLYADAQYLRFAGHDNTAEVGRLFAGIEVLPITALALRVGGTADTDGQTTVSAGVGFYGWKRVQAELAYVYNAFPEIRREFGRAHVVSASLVLVY